jgi:hypothetical protein
VREVMVWRVAQACLWLMTRWWACMVLTIDQVARVPGSHGFWLTIHAMLACLWAVFMCSAWRVRFGAE